MALLESAYEIFLYLKKKEKRDPNYFLPDTSFLQEWEYLGLCH